jgi:hyperosmotically inducible periplasmic protein
MKAIQKLGLFAGAMLIATASLQAYAQDASAPDTATSDTPLSAKQQSKAARAANRALSRKIRAALAKDKSLDTASISVRVKDGTVSLQGLVADQSQIDRATQVVKGVPGVTSVKNSLTIRALGY